MGKTIMSKVKWLIALFAVTVLALLGGIFSLNAKTEAKAEESITVTQVQFRTSGDQYFFFLRMDGQTDYTEGNQWHEPTLVNNTNLLDKVTIYFLNGSATLREVWNGVNFGTYIWTDTDTLVFQMKDGYTSDMGVGARIESGAEIPMLDGTKKVTNVVRTFWQTYSSADNVIGNYTDGYNVINTTIDKVHLRGRLNIGLGEGNDWINGVGRTQILPTEVPAADGTTTHSSTYWRKMLACNFLGKVKLHVAATDTWVTLGSIMNYNMEALQLSYYLNGWGETGGTMQLDINTAYNGTTVDKILFEKGCEFPSYNYLGNADVPYTVHVLNQNYLCTSLDMSQADWAVSFNFTNPHRVTFNYANDVLVNDGETVAFPETLSETKADDEYNSYEYNWFLNGERYDFSTPVTGDINLTSNGTFTTVSKKYTLTYLNEDGSTYTTQQISYGSAIALTAVPAKAGYDGVWTAADGGEIPATMPASDVTLKVEYTKNFHVTHLQFRKNGEESWFFLCFNSSDYVTANQAHDASFVMNTNLLDKVTVYFDNGIYSLRDVWDGVGMHTYHWGDANTLTFRMKDGFVSNAGIGARIAEGAEIPMLDGSILTTETSKTFWINGTGGADFHVIDYVEGYTEIETTIDRVHIREMFMIGLGEGNDWEGKGEALPTQVVDANGSGTYAGANWYTIMMRMANFQTKIKLHVKESNEWVTLGSIMDAMGKDPQWMFIFNGWGEEGGILRISINTDIYNGTTIDKILFEEGCELPSYDMVASASAGHIVHVLTEEVMFDSNDMSNVMATNWNKQYKVTFNGENAVYVNENGTVEYPTDLSVNKDATAEYTYVYNWFLNGEIYDFSTPITGNIDLTSDGSYTEIPNEYTVTYYALDGETVLYKDVFAYGDALTIRPVDSIQGYVDCSWRFNGEAEVPATMPATDISFTVQGAAKTYTLNFGSLSAVEVTYAQAIGNLPAVPAKDGYSGVWTIDGEVITAETVWFIDADKTAAASYTANSYTLTLVANGETVDTLTVTYDAAIGTLPAVPEKTHYVGKWVVDGNVINADTVWTNAGDLTATAEYDPVWYSVTFDNENEVSYAYGSKIEKPADPVKESTAEYNYTFDAWYNGDAKWNFDTDVVEGKMNLVAEYIKSKRTYTVTFNVTGNDAIQLESITAEYGESLDLTGILDGKDVSGYTYSVSVNGVEKASIKVVSDVTVDVVFTEKTDAPADDSSEAPTDGDKDSTADEQDEGVMGMVNGLLDEVKSMAGCSGVIGGLSMAVVAITAAGVALICKRKED